MLRGALVQSIGGGGIPHVHGTSAQVHGTSALIQRRSNMVNTCRLISYYIIHLGLGCEWGDHSPASIGPSQYANVS